MFPAWIAPMRPAPNWQKPIISDVLFSLQKIKRYRGDRQGITMDAKG